MKDPGAGEISTPDYYLTDDDWSGLSSDYYRRMYVWDEGDLFRAEFNDWSLAYMSLYVANTVMDELKRIDLLENKKEWNNVKGQALTFRAKIFLQIAGIWAPAYDKTTAAHDLGIPLRLDANFNEPSRRASVQETYERIITDLKSAIP